MLIRKLVTAVLVGFLCAALTAPCAYAYGGGGGGGGGRKGASPRDKSSFDSTRPSVGGAPVQKLDPHIGAWGIRHETWGTIWGTLEGTAMVLDLGSTVACIFLPGPGWVKGAHTVGKIVAFTRDKRKQNFVKSIFKKLAGPGPSTYTAPPAMPKPDIITPMGHHIYK